MNAFRNSDRCRALGLILCLCALAFGGSGAVGLCHRATADDVASEKTETNQSAAATPSDDKTAGKKIDPGQFHELDDAVRLTVWLAIACSLGAACVMTLIVVGARRLRRLTRSTALKSKYDELELLRAQYRREMEGTETPPPQNREARR